MTFLFFVLHLPFHFQFSHIQFPTLCLLSFQSSISVGQSRSANPSPADRWRPANKTAKIYVPPARLPMAFGGPEGSQKHISKARKMAAANPPPFCSSSASHSADGNQEPTLASGRQRVPFHLLQLSPQNRQKNSLKIETNSLPDRLIPAAGYPVVPSCLPRLALAVPQIGSKRTRTGGSRPRWAERRVGDATPKEEPKSNHPSQPKAFAPPID
jgi:hypothetical protein